MSRPRCSPQCAENDNDKQQYNKVRCSTTALPQWTAFTKWLISGQHSTVAWLSMICLFIVQYSTVQYATLLYSTVYYSTFHYSTVNYSTIHYSTVHFTTPQWTAWMRWVMSTQATQHHILQRTALGLYTALHSTGSKLQYSIYSGRLEYPPC